MKNILKATLVVLSLLTSLTAMAEEDGYLYQGFERTVDYLEAGHGSTIFKVRVELHPGKVLRAETARSMAKAGVLDLSNMKRVKIMKGFGLAALAVGAVAGGSSNDVEAATLHSKDSKNKAPLHVESNVGGKTGFSNFSTQKRQASVGVQ